jgi:ATP-binding protein involved in chromosome partitioning
LPSGIRSLVAVGSGKGGVGKSTVAANLAVALSQSGLRVGLLDADIYGPNQPQMLGAAGGRPKLGPDGRIEPVEAHGVKVMSMGFLLDPGTSVIWRGPMLHSAMNQLLREVGWGELDCLVVDLPPGTGDVQLSISQSVPVTGAVLVTTPQSVALSDVLKSADMFRKLGVPIFGVVENMGEFSCPHCRRSSRIFSAGACGIGNSAGTGRTDFLSAGAAQVVSERYGVPLLASIPLDPEVCSAGECGTPVCVSHPDSVPAQALRAVAAQVAERLSAESKQ